MLIRGVDWTYNTDLTPVTLLKCWHQARNVSGHVYVSGISILPLYLQCVYYVLEVFLQCGSSVYYTISVITIHTLMSNLHHIPSVVLGLCSYDL